MATVRLFHGTYAFSDLTLFKSSALILFDQVCFFLCCLFPDAPLAFFLGDSFSLEDKIAPSLTDVGLVIGDTDGLLKSFGVCGVCSISRGVPNSISISV